MDREAVNAVAGSLKDERAMAAFLRPGSAMNDMMEE